MQRSIQSNSPSSTALPTIPADLESPRAKLVYLYLSMQDDASITDLQKGLEMKKISLYSILGTLCERGLVDQDAEHYRIV